MPRVLIILRGSLGDVLPYLGLAGRLRDAGHPTTIAAVERFRAQVTESGLEFHPLPGDDPEAVADTEEVQAAHAAGARGSAALMRMARDAIREQVPAMLVAAEQADVLLCPLTTLLFVLTVADKCGIPCAAIPVQPSIASRHIPPMTLGGRNFGGPLNKALTEVMGKLGIALYADTINALRDELGLPRTGSGDYDDLPMLHGISPTVLPRPPDWRPGAEMCGYWWPPQSAGWEPPAELAEFLAAGPPPVYVGFGSMGAGLSERLGAAVGDALRRTGLRAVVHGGWAKLAVSGEHVLAVRHMPHEWLFPRMAAVVHHGGAGTTAAALRAGVPSVPVSFAYDQRFWGRRAVALGAAPVALRASTVDGKRLAAALDRSTRDPRYALSANKIAARLSTEDGAARVIETVEHLTATPH